MADMHKKIVLAVISDFSVQNRGRLQELKQGFAIPIQNFKKGIYTPMHFGSDPGTPDLFGDEIMNVTTRPEWSDKLLTLKMPVACYVEVKTIAYPKCSKDQISYLNCMSARGARCYIAMENEDKSEGLYRLIKWGDWK